MRPLNILIVDDEHAFRSTLIKRLNRRGIKALEAACGEDALRMLKRETVSVVVLDVKMPGMDGLETLSHIKRDHPDVAVVLLTGHADRAAAQRAMVDGAFDFILKPIAIHELLWAIEEADRRTREQRTYLEDEDSEHERPGVEARAHTDKNL